MCQYDATKHQRKKIVHPAELTVQKLCEDMWLAILSLHNTTVTIKLKITDVIAQLAASV